MSTDGDAADPIASKNVPRRAAARKASALAVGQVDLSDDEERTGGPFHGSSTPRSLVKVTYGGKRKYKHSPPIPRPVRSRAMSLLESSPKRLQTSSAGRRRDGARDGGGKSLKNGHTVSGSPSSSVENKSVEESDPEIIILEEKPKPSVVIPCRNTVMDGESQSAHVKEGKTRAPANVPKKRPLSRSPSGGSASSLTPMSSPDVPFKPLDFPPPSFPVLAPRLARQFMRVQSQMQPPVISEFKAQPLTQSKSLDNIFTLDSSDSEGESMDEADMGNLVWVSLDLDGILTDSGLGEDTMWWPAKVLIGWLCTCFGTYNVHIHFQVELPKPLMRVSLFGDPPGPKTVDIPKPTASNVRSIEVDGHIRFNENNYHPSKRKSVLLSPRKKRKLDLDVVWRDARNAMVSVHESNDDLAAGSSRYASGSSRGKSDAKGEGKAKADPKGKGKARASDSDMGVGEDAGLGLDLGLDLGFKVERRWRAPSPNPLLEVPGELILARESRTKTQYWPAKILAYVKPTKPSQKPKYKVVFFDSVIKQIEPDWFWTTTDDGFARCNVRPYLLLSSRYIRTYVHAIINR